MLIKRILLYLVSIALFQAGCADLKVAKSAHQTGDYKTAVRHWKKLADHGYPDAQYRLGKSYLKGEGVEKDPEKAYRLFRRAAKNEKRKAPAFFELGRIHDKGEGAKQDGHLAEKYYKGALKRGYERAAYYLARLYHQGTLVEKNFRKAVPLYKRSIDTGYVQAAYQLGQLYSEQSNAPKAIHWYQKAFISGTKKSAYQLGKLYGEQGNGPKAIHWYQKAFSGGIKNAALRLGRLYAKENDNPEGQTLALAWFYIGKKGGDEKANQAAERLEKKLTSDMIAKAADYAVSTEFVAQ